MLRPAAIVVALITALAVTGCDSKDKDQRADVKAKNAGKDSAGANADGKAAPAAPAGKVFWVSPKDGATVPTKVDVEMGVEGKTVEPAGATERDPLKGHHHIIIDGSPIKDMQIVPKDETHLHYGDGSTKTTLMLEPGKHTLTMQFADGAHRSYGEDWSATITVNVSEGPGEGDAAEGDAAEGDAAEGDAAEGDAKADG